MAVAGPAPPDLRRIAVFAAVPAGAVADPQRGGPRVGHAVGIAQPRPDRHEAVIPLEHLRSLEQPMNAFAERERRPSGGNDRWQGLVRTPIGHVIASVGVHGDVHGPRWSFLDGGTKACSP